MLERVLRLFVAEFEPFISHLRRVRESCGNPFCNDRSVAAGDDGRFVTFAIGSEDDMLVCAGIVEDVKKRFVGDRVELEFGRHANDC